MAKLKKNTLNIIEEFTCNYCNEKYEGVTNIAKHLMSHYSLSKNEHSNKNNVLVLIQEYNPTKKNDDDIYKKGRKLILNNSTYTRKVRCNLCNDTFKRMKNLITHKSLNHSY